MSETVQITIIMDDQKKEIKVTHDLSKTLMSTLLEKKLVSDNFCGGRGVCERCRIQFLQAAPLPTATERRAFSPEELRQGYRLACMAKPKNNCVVCLRFISSRKIDVITDMIAVSEKNDHESQAQLLTQPQTELLIAVDLGTTTIAMQLIDMASGQIMDTYCALNPQRRYGADVVSRIQAAAANEESARTMREEVWKVLQNGVKQFRNTIGILYTSLRSLLPEAYMGDTEKTDGIPSSSIRGICIAGNTTMEHLLMGLPTESLGRSPFKPVEIGLQECRLPERDTIPERSAIPEGSAIPERSAIPEGSAIPDGECADTEDTAISSLPVYVLPGISAFVGGDIVAGLYCCHLLDSFQECRRGQNGRLEQNIQQDDHDGQYVYQKQRKGSAVLFIDLGTNGEMAIADDIRMIVTATAAGPAFEGGAGASVHGSDMIAITASLLEQGIIDETGLMAQPYFEAGITVSIPNKEEKIHLTQKDIRDLQMAKAAVRAGVEILCGRMGNPAVSKVYLAGGFGYYLNADAAVRIGLLPQNMRETVQAVGNTSLAGASLIGKDLLTKRLTKEQLEQKLSKIETINLAKQKTFEALYLKHLNFYVSGQEDIDDAIGQTK